MSKPTTGERQEWQKFECPTCFRADTAIRRRELREEGYSVIRRKCKNPECPPFTTAESVVYDDEGELATFTRLAPNHRLKDRMKKQREMGYQSRRTVAVTDSIIIRITYLRGKGSEYKRTECYRGHRYTEESSYLDRQGKIVCRECRKIAQATYSANHPERVAERNRRYQRLRRARKAREAQQQDPAA